MIVVDTNILGYLLLPGENTEVVEEVYRKDADWVAPPIWMSELQNVLVQYLKRDFLDVMTACDMMEETQKNVVKKTITIPSYQVIKIAHSTGLSAYDAQYVGLAEHLSLSLMTFDQEILTACPKLAKSPMQ